MTFNRVSVLLIATAFVFVAVQPAGAQAPPSPTASARQANTGVVEGVVKNASGQAVTGAFVKLRNDARRLTFMVISQAQGRYTADQLPPGKYTVQGAGAGFESAWSAPVDVASGKATNLDLSLAKQMGPTLPPAWPNRIAEDLAVNLKLPEGKSKEEGKGKELVQARCVACHGLDDVMKMRVDRKTWQMFLEQMAEEVVDRKLRPWTAGEAATMLDYLSASFQPMPIPDPNSRLPRTLMTGATAKYRVVEYDLVNGDAQTHDVASDPWGHGWANQRAGFLSHLDPDTLMHEEIAPPPAQPGAVVRPGNLQVSADGKVWFPEGRRMMSYDIKAKTWATYDYPGRPAGRSRRKQPDCRADRNGVGFGTGHDQEPQSQNQGMESLRAAFPRQASRRIRHQRRRRWKRVDGPGPLGFDGTTRSRNGQDPG